jgi:hypothetical protein
MKCLIATAFFALIIPIYGQEKGSQAQPHKDGTAQPKQVAPQTTPPTVNVINQQAPTEQQNRAKANSEGYFSRLFAPENLPNIGLFLAGVVGIGVAIRTLRAIESQTRVLVESQRPRIVANPHGDPSKTLADPNARRVELEIVNKGSMPATDYRYESWIEVLPFPFEDFTVAADHFKYDITSVLYPDTPQVINIPIRGGITPEDFTEVRRLRKHVCVRLKVEYADPFIANRRCYANFGFHILPKGLGFLPKHNGVGYEDKRLSIVPNLNKYSN